MLLSIKCPPGPQTEVNSLLPITIRIIVQHLVLFYAARRHKPEESVDLTLRKREYGPVLESP